ncbi:MAG: PorV/PorQ family protein [Candidatus Latescibacterota bacterium]
MIKTLLTVLLLGLVGASSGFCLQIHDHAGATGMKFLQVGIGGRAAAMGGAYSAISGDVTAGYWNPAGLIGIEGKDAAWMHTTWMQGIRGEYAGLAFGNGRRSVGISARLQSAGDLERREGPTIEPLGMFGVYDAALTCSYAQHLNPWMDFGVNLHALYEKIHIEAASGWAMDIGMLFRTVVEGLQGAFVLRHLGATHPMNTASIDLPTEIRTGISYGLRDRLLLSADVSFPNDDFTHVHLGLEYRFGPLLAFRAGTQTGADEQDYSAGLGFAHGIWRLDYAFVPYRFDLGNTHRVSLGVRL